MTTETKTVQYRIHSSQISTLKERLAKINRKAAKLNLPEVTIAWGKEVLVPQEDGTVEQYMMADITAAVVRLAGWRFVATLDHGSEAGVVIRAAPGNTAEIPVEYRTAGTVCHHCNTVRARSETFLVANESGDIKQVGRSCLSDFLFGMDAHGYANMARWAVELAEACNEAGMGGGSGGDVVSLKVLLATVVAVVRVENDWVSRGRARAYNEQVVDARRTMMATVDCAVGTIVARTPQAIAATRQWRPTEEDFVKADEILAWAQETIFSKPELNDFEHNLKVSLSGALVSFRNAGIAASVVGVHRRAIEQAVERAARAELGRTSAFMGTVGEWVEASVKVLATKDLTTNWGTSTLYKLITEEGNLMTWFASSPWETLNQETFTKVRAKVKKHETFRDEQQTVVTHVGPPKTKKAKKAA